MSFASTPRRAHAPSATCRADADRANSLEKLKKKKCSAALEDREMHATVLAHSLALFAKTLKMH
jgi:hypothetical protein